MDPTILGQIRSINNQFYQTFADSFAETRGRLQQGVLRLLPTLLHSEKVLDLGCGNGELASQLLQRGFAGDYLGIDLSKRMLAIARANVDKSSQAAFIHVELGLKELEGAFEGSVEERFLPPYNDQLCFATLHHIPGKAEREALARTLHGLAEENGRVLVSVWNFMASERLRERLIPWDRVGLSEEQVEPGDHLIDWRRDGEGMRYVHHFAESELSALAQQAGFEVIDTFYSDGETGTLGLYQVWNA